MPHTPTYAQVSEAQKVLWRAELREVMQSEQNLAPYVNMIDVALFFTADAQSVSSLGLGAAQLIAYRDLVQPKYVIVVFKVLKQHREIGTSSSDHAMVEITLYVQANLINGDPYVNLVVSPNDQAPIEFICHATGCGSAIVNTTTVGLTDLLDRFPQHVENILTQISFVTGLMPREMGGNQ
jgi:hypothetical protein